MGSSILDLAIIGGGPAGTSAAIEARRHGMEVAIWERDRFPRHKVCGEFISAESLPLLQGIIPETLKRAPPIRQSEFISAKGHVSAFSFLHFGCGLSRRLLDEALWIEAGRAGAHLHVAESAARLRRVNQSRNGGSAWEIQSAGGVISLARTLLIACGRWWSIEGFPSPADEQRDRAAGPWMGVKAHFSGIAPRDAVEMYYFPGGYCGVAPIEDGLYNACCMVHCSLVRDAATTGIKDFASWLKAVTRHPVLDSRLRGAIQASETVSTSPLRPARRRSTCDGVLLVGDASGFLDPFTGDGISMALQSGRLASAELARALSRNEMNSNQAARHYRSRLRIAVRRSYIIAGALRALVCAPAGVQASAAAALPWLGSRLLAHTRWRVRERL